MKKSSKIIISIVAFLVLAAGIVAGTYLVQKNQDIREKAAPSTSLSFFPAVVTKSPGQTFNLTINADTGTNKITGIDIEVSFDPAVIQMTQVTPTAAISPLSTLIKNGVIDNVTGKARFAAFTVTKADAVSGNLDIINLAGTIKSGAANGQYPIAFTATTTIAAVDEGLSVVVNTTPANITVSAGASASQTPTPTATSSSASRTPTPTATTAGGIGGAQITLPTATPTVKPSSTATTATTTSSSATSTATMPPVPVTGVSLPFIGAVSLGMGAIILSVFLAL